MTCRTCKRNRVCRAAGFTLMEMLLVIAILVIAAAVVWPAIHGPMADQQLQKSGDLIRAQWGRARVEAMKTGQIHVFRYENGGGGYLVEPWQGDLDASSLSGQTLGGSSPSSPGAAPGQFMTDSSASQGSSSRGTGNRIGSRCRLPTGVTFYSGQASTDARSAQVDDVTSIPSESGGWARPIVFYPDGSSTDAKLLLTNERCFVEVRLRGLTGFSQTSDLLSQNELTP